MSDGLSQFSMDELEAIQKGDLSKLSMDKLMLLQQVAGGMPSQQQEPAPIAPIPVAVQPPAPTQRLRAIAQGATLTGADEAEAYLRSLAGEDYESALADIRSKTKAYQKEAPYEALGYEALGGLLPAAAVTLGTGGTSAPATGRPRLWLCLPGCAASCSGGTSPQRARPGRCATGRAACPKAPKSAAPFARPSGPSPE